MQHLQSSKICVVIGSRADVVIFRILFRTFPGTHLHFGSVKCLQYCLTMVRISAKGQKQKRVPMQCDKKLEFFLL